ncbi:RDD family protein [Actinomadura roseirufa]|uniref:RDD family protein n=1 Tax=Actinomadura roseirufa TaxID=2094049 RepID=UPI001040E645|nr:RDD family protein [Actinomadura roseirufa]
MHGPSPYPPPYPPPLPAPVFPHPDAEIGPDRRRRLAAWGIDAALLACVAALLATMTWGRLHTLVLDGLWGRLLSATIGLLLSGGDVGKAAADFGAGVWGTVVSDIEQALLLMVLIEFAYHFAGQAWAGRTLGKAALDLRVRGVEGAPLGKGRAAGRAFVTTLGGTGVYSVAWALLLEGEFFFSLVVWFAAVAFFAANSAPALFGSRGRTLADLMASTTVVRADGYTRAAELARQGAGAAWDGAQAAGQVAGQAVRDHAVRVAQAEHAQRLQELGRQSAGRVRDAMASERAQQVQDAGKRMGGRLKDAYNDRRSARDGQTPPVPPAHEPPALAPPQPQYDPYGYGNPHQPYAAPPQQYGPPQQQPYAPPRPYMPPPQYAPPPPADPDGQDPQRG